MRLRKSSFLRCFQGSGAFLDTNASQAKRAAPFEELLRSEQLTSNKNAEIQQSSGQTKLPLFVLAAFVTSLAMTKFPFRRQMQGMITQIIRIFPAKKAPKYFRLQQQIFLSQKPCPDSSNKLQCAHSAIVDTYSRHFYCKRWLEGVLCAFVCKNCSE